MRPTQNQPRDASKTWACRATPTKPAISRRLILRKAGRALGEGKKVTVLLQKGWVPVSIAQKAEAPTVPTRPAEGSRFPCVDEFKFSQDAASRNTLLLRMGHTSVEIKANGYCGYHSLSEMYCVMSPFDVAMYWRAVFVSRVAEKAATDFVTAEKEAANAMRAKRG